MRGHSIEHLTAIGDIADEIRNAGMIEWLQIEVENVVTLGFKPWHYVTPCLACAACKQNTFGHGLLPDPISSVIDAAQCVVSAPIRQPLLVQVRSSQDALAVHQF
jgi:hypothetical protein